MSATNTVKGSDLSLLLCEQVCRVEPACAYIFYGGIAYISAMRSTARQMSEMPYA